MQQLQSIDILLLVPVIMGAYNGYKRGLLVEIIGLVAFAVAILFGFRYLGLGMDLVAEFLNLGTTGKMLPYMSFLLIFFPTAFAINKIGWIFRKALRITFLGTLDGLAGAALGAILWFFGLSVLIWIGSAVGIGIPERYLVGSEIYPFLEHFAPNLIDKVSEYLPSMSDLLDKFKEIGEAANQ